MIETFGIFAGRLKYNRNEIVHISSTLYRKDKAFYG